MAMSVLASYSYVSGVPQSPQKPRRTVLELRKCFGCPRVQANARAATKSPPMLAKAFWHMRQWHIDARPSCETANRTAPH